MHPLCRSVARYVRKHGLLDPGDRVGIAVSGGADSVALLRILLELRDHQGLVLSVSHLNHCLRGEESDGDEKFVGELASRYDLPFHCTRRDTQAHASKHKLSIETAAREVRYRYLEGLLRDGSFNKLATAHTLDDQAETVLLKLSRGAGTRGLAGIYPCIRLEALGQAVHLAIVRPLLATARGELESYLTQIGQPWREDSSNAQLHHTRNRIRHEILPKLSELVNPDVRQTLADTARIAHAEEDFWAEETARHLPSVWSEGPRSGTLDYSRLQALPLALERRLVRSAARQVGLSLEFSHVEQVLALAQQGARTDLVSGWIARRDKEFICFEPRATIDSLDYEYPLPVPGSVKLPQAGLIVTCYSRISNRADEYPGFHDLLDSRFAENLRVRNWRAGDRFWPSNKKEPKKVKELLQGRHITGAKKKGWPVITSGDEVIWVRGFGVRRDCRTINGTGVLITEQAPTKDD